ncbi:MAG TPA: CaiB/BaiF CoA-transferase family protein [Actinomycetota bacterium]|nr:CaiB/BaiF CoA-transferase family protein [Actinomycetota bacterium]
MRGPLEGVKVLAFEQAIALPFCSFIFAELGADVIKIEQPGRGDVVRGWDRVVGGLSSGFVAFNAGKRDISVDVSKPDGQLIVSELAARADVFIENFAPGVVDRLGLGHETLRGESPRLIYASLSGYGQDGPYRDVKAFDLLIQGEAGILMTNGYPEAPAKVGMPITDLIGGSHVAMGVLAALYERERTGVGSYIDLALLDSAFFWSGYFPHYEWHGQAPPPRSGMRHQFICPYGPYLASDGKYVNLVVASEKHWKIFCEKVVARPAWIEDPRFSSIEARLVNREQLELAVEEVIATAPHDEWMRRAADAQLPYGEVRDMASVVGHPQLASRGMIVRSSSPVGEIPLARFPLSTKTRRSVPEMGEHTEEILRELGYDLERIESLRRSGVI